VVLETGVTGTELVWLHGAGYELLRRRMVEVPRCMRSVSGYMHMPTGRVVLSSAEIDILTRGFESTKTLRRCPIA
jgi:hypothetical protein